MIDWNALYKVSLGLYVLGAKDENRQYGSIIDAVMVVANKPVAIAISCNNLSKTAEIIKKTKEFSLSVLPFDVDPFVVANFGFQSSKNIDKWANIPYEIFYQLPVLSDAVAHISAKVINQYSLDSNTVFIAEVTNAEVINDKKELLYEDYRKSFKDKVIKSFQQFKRRKTMAKKWVCTVCGWVYDGDIPFEELPDDYVCPMCGVDKSNFELQEVDE